MSYKRNSEPARQWQSWRAANVNRIITAGVPILVLDSERRWLYFVDHGYDPESGWGVHLLADTERELLRDVLVAEYSQQAATTCLGAKTDATNKN